jgi:hypothetical protein
MGIVKRMSARWPRCEPSWGAEAFARAWAAGRALSLEQALPAGVAGIAGPEAKQGLWIA